MLALFLVLFLAVWVLNPESIVANNGQYSFNLSGSSSSIVLLLMTVGMVWTMGAPGQHLLNHSFGKKNISLTVSGVDQEVASWIDGFTLQWALFWRFFLINFVLMLVIVMLGIGEEAAVLADGSVIVNYRIQDPKHTKVLFFVFYTLASWHLLKKPFGIRIYSVELKSREDSEKNL